jgi:prepilin-type N-terminal cleavage/methylation domain-containing protein
MARLFRKLGDSEGFTIIELLVVVAVLSVGLAAIAVA